MVRRWMDFFRNEVSIMLLTAACYPEVLQEIG